MASPADNDTIVMNGQTGTLLDWDGSLGALVVQSLTPFIERIKDGLSTSGKYTLKQF